MAKMISIEVLGDKALQRKLRALPIAMEKKIVRKALREAGRPILASAKALVPVRTGALKKSLRLRALKRSRGSFGVQVRTGTREELGIPADAPYYYPMAVEVGTGHAPAHPYMRPALKSNEGKSIRIAAAEIRRGIEEVARSG